MLAVSRDGGTSPRRVLAWLAAGLLIAAALSGCGEDEPPSGPGPRPGPIPANGLAAVCSGVHYPDGAAYQGPGPHPTQVYWLGADIGGAYLPGSQLLDEAAETSQPWESWAAGDPSVIELVACEESRAMTPTGATCEMSVDLSHGGGIKQLPLRAQSVVLTVHEVRTGREVAEIPLEPAATCPVKYLLRSGDDWVAVKPTAQQVQVALLPQVTAALPAAGPAPAD